MKNEKLPHHQNSVKSKTVQIGVNLFGALLLFLLIGEGRAPHSDYVPLLGYP